MSTRLVDLHQCQFDPGRRKRRLQTGTTGAAHPGQTERERPPEKSISSHSNFRIEMRFLGGLTDSQKMIFETAANRWSEIIVGDLQSIRLPTGEIVDDLLIDAQGVNIDGIGGVLGRAGPQIVRDNALPAKGIMEFDTADLQNMESEGSLLNVIIHEMGHVIGIGTIWDDKGLLVGCPTANPIFLGARAKAEFGVLTSGDAAPVPVANTGGPGTRCGHWRESVFGHELMTGFLNSGSNPVSKMTIASLEDLGYEVNYAAADPYSLPSSLELALMGIGADGHRRYCQMCGGGAKPIEPVVLPKESYVD